MRREGHGQRFVAAAAAHLIRITRVSQEPAEETTMMRMLAFTAGLALATVCRAQDNPEAARAKWEQKSAELQDKDLSDFRAAIVKLDRPPHARAEISGLGGSIYRSSWSGNAIQVDADWWIVREAAVPTNIGPTPPGVPIKTSVVGLPDLRSKVDPEQYEAIQVIHRSPMIRAVNIDPVNLIRAVNFLQALGEDKACSALSAYERLCDANPALVWHELNPERIILIARLLYERAPNGPLLREPLLGAPGISITKGTTADALFPLALQDDVPFIVNDGYDIAGHAEDPITYMNYLRANGRFRTKPLVPITDPVTAATKLLNTTVVVSSPGIPADQRVLELLVSRQALEALGMTLSVYAWDQEWEAAKADSQVSTLRWSAEKQDFVHVK
jgi:hypothetical protein